MILRIPMIGCLLIALCGSLGYAQSESKETNQQEPTVDKATQPDSYYLEDHGLVAIEAENTSSKLDKWERKTEPLQSRHFGEGYLEFTGNNPKSGPAKSPLTYSFKITNGGLYRIHLHCARETIDGRKDIANDCYVRLKGDFGPGPKPGNAHGNDAPLALLKKDTKFYGGDDKKFVWASGKRLDPGGHNNKRNAVYHLKAGEIYTLTVSGRSQKFKLDRILFRHESLPAKVAEDLKVQESKRNKKPKAVK